jgi:excisionase family DNA binding protein
MANTSKHSSVVRELNSWQGGVPKPSSWMSVPTRSEVEPIAGNPLTQTFIERLRLTKRYLGAREVVAILGVHITTLQLWTKHRQIPHLKVGHGIRFDPVELAEWLSTRQIGTR